MAEPKRFKRDGKMWTYTPGPGGSLISDPDKGAMKMGMILNNRRSAKSIVAPELKKP